MEHSFDQLSNSETAKSKNQKTGLLLMLVFFLPVIIAYGLLKTGIYQNFGTFNKGNLLNPTVQIHDYLQQQFNSEEQDTFKNIISKNWWIAYEVPEQCLEACQQRLLQIRQSLQTLGSDQVRVQPLLIKSAASDNDYLKLLAQQLESHHISYHTVNKANKTIHFDTFAGQKPGGLYIIDPMGNAMLYYAPVIAPTEAISQAKSVIKDLKYLLKVSRIG